MFNIIIFCILGNRQFLLMCSYNFLFHLLKWKFKSIVHYMVFKGENLRHHHVLITVNIFQYQKKIICDQIRQSATSPVLQGRFQCHKKQLARINVIDLK